MRLTRPDAELSLSALADRVGRLERGADATASRTVRGATAKAVIGPSRLHRRTPASTDEPGDDTACQRTAIRRQERGAPSAGAPGVRAPAGAGEAASARRRALRQETSTAPRPAPNGRASPPRRTAQPGPTTVDGRATERHARRRRPHRPPTCRRATRSCWRGATPCYRTLPAKAKSRFASGRFVAVEPDAVIFGLPNKIHAAKCEEVRPEVEAALAAHFGRATPLRIDRGRGCDTSTPRRR